MIKEKFFLCVKLYTEKNTGCLPAIEWGFISYGII